MTDKLANTQDKGETHEPLYGMVPLLILKDLTITDGAIRLFGYMWWRYGKNKDNHEGHKSMAEVMGVSQATISNRIEELEYNDWVVVIELERNQKNGNYRTPYYHLFLTQEEAKSFRDSYKCKDGESIRPKPNEAREKKSRKGKGGKPSNLAKYNEINHSNSSSYSHSNSSLSGGTNSGQVGGTNSSLSELESSDPHPDSNTKTGNKESPIPPEKDSGEKSDPQKDAIKQAEDHLKQTDPFEDSRIAENQAQNLIRSYLNLTQSVDTAMLNHSERKAEALRLLDKDITAAHIQVYLKRHKTETGYWKDKNVPWKVLIGDIVSHFQLRSLVSSLTPTPAPVATTYTGPDDDEPYVPFVVPKPKVQTLEEKYARFMANTASQVVSHE